MENVNKTALNHSTEKIETLIPYARNARVHTQEHVAQLAASIREFGFNTPVLIDSDKTIIAGHGRVLAARKLGIEEVPVVYISHLTEGQKKAFILADNKIHDNSTFDAELLQVELEELTSEGFDLAIAGFGDLSDLNFTDLGDGFKEGTEGLTDPDAAPDHNEELEPITKPGDVWILGNHRIICGSSTEAHTVEKVLNGALPHLMVTDPPYGVEYDASWREKRLGGGKRADGKVENDDQADWTEAWSLFPGEVAYVWHASTRSHIVAKSLLDCDFNIRSQIIWAKNHFAIGRSDYHHQHEPCWYAVKQGKQSHYNGDRTQSTVWNIPKPQKSETGHSTQKPIDCMKKPIENNSNPGDGIYEPFSGSGTTIIACEQTGRKCYAIELNPAYVDMAVKRWEQFTGKKATLESTGEEFPEH